MRFGKSATAAPEPFESVWGYILSIEATSAETNLCRATLVYANAAPYDPTRIFVVWVDKPALQSLLQTALVTGNLLYFEGIKFYDAALQGVEQFHLFARMVLFNSPQGARLSDHPRIDPQSILTS
ncbi:MAG TPA: hypothetical protein VKW08_28520 [Xanthobacteraceae bacterium]|jgi:hypothetical protein|nr:hypothetical protein [Xanthobacteraceae bacterium]